MAQVRWHAIVQAGYRSQRAAKEEGHLLTEHPLGFPPFTETGVSIRATTTSIVLLALPSTYTDRDSLVTGSSSQDEATR